MEMNYFELLDLPFTYSIDKGLLKRNFLMKSKEAHPDFFTQDSDEAQSNALDQSAKLNDAYQILNNDERRLNYILEQRGVVLKDEKHQLLNTFLMEMMDLNEAWMDAETEEEKQKVIHQVKQIQNDIYEPLKATLETADINDIPPKKLLQIKEYYYKKKYLNRILADFHE